MKKKQVGVEMFKQRSRRQTVIDEEEKEILGITKKPLSQAEQAPRPLPTKGKALRSKKKPE